MFHVQVVKFANMALNVMFQVYLEKTVDSIVKHSKYAGVHWQKAMFAETHSYEIINYNNSAWQPEKIVFFIWT